jgi:hypothetical protein
MQSSHPHLQSLDLSYNAITQFTLDLLQSLKALKLSHNPDLSLKVNFGAFPQNQHSRHIPDVHQIFVTIIITANRRSSPILTENLQFTIYNSRNVGIATLIEKVKSFSAHNEYEGDDGNPSHLK